LVSSAHSNAEVAHRELMANLVWWAEHYPEFLASHPERYVAVRDRSEVVDSDTSMLDLCERLRHRGIEPSTDVSIQLITRSWPQLL
jgi:hypothetical protein